MKHINIRTLVSLLFATLFSLNAFAGLERLPVQDGGRIKPYDTFAREVLHLLWGRETYKKRPATEIVFSWFMLPDEWDKEKIILIRHSGLREALNLPGKELYYSSADIMTNDRLGLLMQELKNKRDAKEKMDPFFQAVQTLENQLSAFHAVRLGLGLRVMPNEGDNHNWKNITQLQGEYKDKFQNITAKYVAMAAAEAKKDASAAKAARADIDTAVMDFVKAIEAKFGDYSHDNRLMAEVHYNSFLPFRWAWVFYLFALVFFSFAYFGSKTHWVKIGWWLTGVAAAFHTWGFALRIYILERAPITNMFETVAWVALATIIMAAIIYKLYGSKIVPVAAAMVAVLSLILCDVSSSVLDETLSPLEPVLRDNFWLLTHVVIIVTSYAAFFLAFFIGDILLYYYIRDEKHYQERIAQGALAIYRSIQVGVVLLAAGTILGGVWADYSWGRFWGWDPKETWAFIALMGYIVILHGRIAGWLRHFGMAVGAVLSFSLVIMAWYGVNFVLGAGLHTYGFGAGGVEYVSAFVAAHVLYVAYVATLRQSRLKSPKT